MAQSNDSKCFQIVMRMNCPDCGLPNCGRWLGHEDMAQDESIKKQHLQTESEIEDKCRADLMYWNATHPPDIAAEIIDTAPVHCNYCGQVLGNKS